MCGGTPPDEICVVEGEGLSPRVRGNRSQPSFSAQCRRSIPACAGEPFRLFLPESEHGVYPRVCGGTSSSTLDISATCGLSPRVRGNPLQPRTQDAHRRSIPACAGEPTADEDETRRIAVYPRVCGGTVTVQAFGKTSYGLSPRVRGNLLNPWLWRPSMGSIPACAGEPLPTEPRLCAGAVYPRVCGGTVDSGWDGGGGDGLSPRVRGNRGPRRPTPSMIRSIPACAGEPGRRSDCEGK